MPDLATNAQELISAVDNAHKNSVSRIEDIRSQLVQALHNERIAHEMRQSVYDNRFARGFIIDQVVDPSAIEYELSGDSGWYDVEPEHAAMLPGKLAVLKRTIGVPRISDYIAQMGPQNVKPGILKDKLPSTDVYPIEFFVPGMSWNIETGEPVFNSEASTDHRAITAYEAPLAAFEWHIPTNMEVAAHIQAATFAAIQDKL